MTLPNPPCPALSLPWTAGTLTGASPKTAGLHPERGSQRCSVSSPDGPATPLLQEPKPTHTGRAEPAGPLFLGPQGTPTSADRLRVSPGPRRCPPQRRRSFWPFLPPPRRAGRGEDGPALPDLPIALSLGSPRASQTTCAPTQVHGLVLLTPASLAPEGPLRDCTHHLRPRLRTSCPRPAPHVSAEPGQDYALGYHPRALQPESHDAQHRGGGRRRSPLPDGFEFPPWGTRSLGNTVRVSHWVVSSY